MQRETDSMDASSPYGSQATKAYEEIRMEIITHKILPGTPIENISAFLDEALSYGAEHRRA